MNEIMKFMSDHWSQQTLPASVLLAPCRTVSSLDCASPVVPTSTAREPLQRRSGDGRSSGKKPPSQGGF